MMPKIRTKNIYEAIMYKQKMAEAKKQKEIVENKKFFQESSVRAIQEKRWTSKNSFDSSIMAYLMPDKEAVVYNLESRRNKLRNLLETEADLYEYILKQAPPDKDSSYSYLRRVNETLHNERLIPNGERTLTKCPTPGKSNGEICEYEKALDDRHENKVVENDDSACFEERTVVYDSHNPKELQRDSMLQQKLGELKQFELETEELNAIGREIVEQQRSLQKLAAERREVNEARHQRRFEKVLLRQQSAALKRRCRCVQAELTSDLNWLGRLSALVDGEDVEDWKEEVRSRIACIKETLEKDLQREIRREEDMQDMLASEATELSRKRDQEWNYEEDARRALLNEVLALCQDRIYSRLRAFEDMKTERGQLHSTLLGEIDAVKPKTLSTDQETSNANVTDDDDNDADSNRRSREAEKTTGRRRAEVTFDETLKEEAAKLNIAEDDFAKFAPELGNTETPFFRNRRKTQLW